MKNHLLVTLFVLLVISSILYLIPNFSFTRDNKAYSFINFPSPLNPSYERLKINVPGITKSYQTVFESNNDIEDPKEWQRLVSRDQKTLSQRLELAIGEDFEIRTDKIDDRVRFTVNTSDKLLSTALLTASNSTFELYSVQASTTSPQVPTSPQNQQKTLLEFTRSDFGFAETITAQGQNPREIQYQVRMPLGLLLGPDKIQLISNNLFSQLSLSMADGEFQAGFDYNQAGVATHLSVRGLQTKSEADFLKSFLNSSPYNLNYKQDVISRNYYFTNTQNTIALFSLVAVLIIVAAIYNRFVINTLSIRKILLVLGITVIYLGGLKLFALEFTLVSLLVLTATIILTIFNSKIEFYTGVFAVLFLTKLLGFLPGFDITLAGAILISAYGFTIYLTNYVQKIDKKLIK